MEFVESQTIHRFVAARITGEIYLKLDWKILELFRNVQSEYLVKCTQYQDIDDAAKNGNLANI